MTILDSYGRYPIGEEMNVGWTTSAFHIISCHVQVSVELICHRTHVYNCHVAVAISRSTRTGYSHKSGMYVSIPRSVDETLTLSKFLGCDISCDINASVLIILWLSLVGRSHMFWWNGNLLPGLHFQITDRFLPATN